uniref:Uncharacterized protein n=1 Tax=Arundo donax TaxID=35708 RepID=A0A0A8YXW3_ARUDO
MTPLSAPSPAPLEFLTPLADDDEWLDACHKDTPLRYRTVTNILGDVPIPSVV